MLIQTATTDLVRLVTSVAADVDVHASWMDHTLSTDNYEAGRTPTAITTAATTTIVAAPAAGVTRNVKTIHIRNKDAADTVDVTVVFEIAGPVTYELHKVTLLPGEALEYVEGVGFFTLVSAPKTTTNASTSDQTANAADTYLTGSNLTVVNRLKVGTMFFIDISATKTAAGTATPIFSVRFGTAGTTADTARLTFTGAAQTAAVDTGVFRIVVLVRGPIGASCVVQGTYSMQHDLDTTGIGAVESDALQAVSEAFDVTVAGTIMGVSVNPGASGVWTVTKASIIGINMS